jgi:hypothetical protein
MPSTVVAECELDRTNWEGTLTAMFSNETFKEQFNILLHPTYWGSRDIPLIILECAIANPAEFPARGQPWKVRPTYGWYAGGYAFRAHDKTLKRMTCEVTYAPIPPNQPNTQNSGDNPLNFPATYTLDWIEYEEAIEEAYNVQAFGGNTEKGERVANTLGPVTNSAREEAEEGIYETYRDAVVNIHKNFASLNQVIQFQLNYAHTTNSDTYLGAEPGRAKFLSIEAGSEQELNGWKFYPATIRVQICKTTNFKMNNVGWNYYDVDLASGKKQLTRFKVLDPESKEMVDSPEPQFLQLDGSKQLVPDATQLEYYHLRKTSYAGLNL